MITATLTTLIVSIFAFMGMPLSVAEIGMIAVAVKVLVVSGILGFGLRWWRARQNRSQALPPLGSGLLDRHEAENSAKP